MLLRASAFNGTSPSRRPALWPPIRAFSTSASHAADPDGVITRVEFYANGALTGAQQSYPFVIAPFDFDNDGKTDLSVYHPTNGGWDVLNSSTGNHTTRNWCMTTEVVTFFCRKVNSARATYQCYALRI
jgi:hypothetical protein